MVIAACTENLDGEFPSQIASRKGFTDLESDLLQFVEKEIGETLHNKNCPTSAILYHREKPVKAFIFLRPIFLKGILSIT